MAVDGSLQLGYKDTAWFTANASVVLKVGQIVYLEQTGTYKLGDGSTALSALSFLGSVDGNQNLQDVINENPTVNGLLVQSPDGFTFIAIDDTGIQLNPNGGLLQKDGEDIATLNDIGTDYTEKFAYTGSTYTLTVAPIFIYSIRTTTMVLDETDSNDVTIVGTTLTVVNPNFLSGESLYIKYKA